MQESWWRLLALRAVVNLLCYMLRVFWSNQIQEMLCWRVSPVYNSLRQHARVYDFSILGLSTSFHHLLPEFSALDNAALPYMIAGHSPQKARLRARELLVELGLEERLDHQPAQLSGGEQQRVALARALVNDPLVLLADEPTGNLDPSSSASVFQNLSDLARDKGVTTLVATHNLELISLMDRAFTLRDGKVEAYVI